MIKKLILKDANCIVGKRFIKDESGKTTDVWEIVEIGFKAYEFPRFYVLGIQIIKNCQAIASPVGRKPNPELIIEFPINSILEIHYV